MAKAIADRPKVCRVCGTDYLAYLEESRACSKRCRLRMWRATARPEIARHGSVAHIEKQRRIALERGWRPPSRAGAVISEETRAKLSAAHMGKPKPWLIGRVLSAEHRRKIGAAASAMKTWVVLFRPDVRARALEASRENRPTGTRHWNWKNGKTSFMRRIVCSPAWKAWRMAVFQRDDYACQDCSVRGGRLESHHILPKAKFPLFMFVVDNGITLCSNCHATREGRTKKGAQ